MHIEVLPGTANVVRFPVERRARATTTRLRELAPDVREVEAIAETLGFEPVPFGYRDQVDAETARHIAEQAPASRPVAEGLLRGLETAATGAALAAVLAARDAAGIGRQARGLLEHAEREGGYVLEPLRDRAERLTREAATLLLEAHVRCEAAQGVARAVGLARRGEAWGPRDVQAEMDALTAVHVAAAG